MSRSSSEFRFICYAGGIFICYFAFGMLQELITRGTYGENEKFTCAMTLVLIQCIANTVFAQILMLSWKHEKDTTPTFFYASSAMTYLIAMIGSNMALQWINYPTQVVGKAAKPIPVIILGALLGNKVYPVKKYFFIFLIVAGVVLFMIKDSVKSTGDYQGVGAGEVLLLLSLTCDGLTGAIQERIKAKSSPTAYSMMLNMNAWSSLMVSGLVFYSGELFKFQAFISKYPEVLVYVVMLAVCGALGQLFIFFMVSEFGPLPCSVVTTTRKFFTVLVSVFFFNNVLVPRQWFGAVLVFTGLFLDIYFSKSKSQQKKVVKK